jgi:hypothetical protein
LYGFGCVVSAVISRIQTFPMKREQSLRMRKRVYTVLARPAGLLILSFAFFSSLVLAQNPAPPTRALGTIKSISSSSFVLITDTGAEVAVNVGASTKIVRISPGEKDLKNAEPLAFADLQQGDRILVRGAAGADGKTIQAASIIAMKQEDIARKRAHEREEWQRHGVGGLVKDVDAAAGTIEISTNAAGPNKDVTVHVTPRTILRRYAPDSVKFDDAKPAPIGEIKTGDQLRARGAGSADGRELAADEIVSGSFRNIAGTIVSVDPSAGVLTVHDLAAKQDVQVRVTPQTQMRKLPPPLAQRIAVRLKGGPPAGEGQEHGARPVVASEGGRVQGENPANHSGGDFQQLISRLPAASLSDLQKGEAVMIVATQGDSAAGITAVTLLGGVEPILQASPKGAQDMILSPWSLGGGGEAAAGAETP